MKQTTHDLIEQTRKELFESDEFAVVRKILTWVPPNLETQTEVDIDDLLQRNNDLASDMQEWVDSFNF
jgi:hypothetical protein